MRNLLAIASLLFAFFQISTAQIGFVGNMFPAPGSTTMATYDPVSPNAVTVYVQVYKGGVTEPSGQGAGITCEVYYGDVTNFGDPWMSTNIATMTYNVDFGNNDEYQGDIIVSANTNYEFTCRCTDDGGANYVWVDLGAGGNAKIEVEAVLPVELIRFNGVVTGNQAILLWESENEINFKQYELEHGIKEGTQINWDAFRTMLPLNRAERNSYTASIDLEQKGIHYFRIKMEDLDGSHTYSKVISLNNSKNNVPTFNALIDDNLVIRNLGMERWIVELYSLKGQLVYQQKLTDQEIATLNCASLEMGMYNMHLKSIDQQTFWSQLIFKK